MSWTPNQEELHQVMLLLQHSQSTNTEVQRNVQQRLDELNGHETFCCYLAYILSELTNEQEACRSLAGLILKNNIRARWTHQPHEIKEYVKERTLRSMADPSPLIRATVGIIVTTVVFEEGIAGWPQLLPTLAQMLDQPDANMQEGAMGALQKMYEDSGDRMEKEQHIDPMMSRILAHFNSESPRMRGMAMNSVNCILMVQTEPIDGVIDQFLNTLFARAHDTDEEVQRQLCRSLTLLLDSHLEKMLPNLPNVVDYIIVKTQDANEQIAIEACEFWLALAENSQVCKQLLAPFLGKLIPVLVRSMKYSETDIILLKGNCDEEDSMVPDRAEDIRPVFHRSKQRGAGGEGEEDEDDDDDASTEWNLRKCAAASLDVLSSIFTDEMLPILLPILKELLFHHEWEVRESGILALGAVAEGCMSGITPHLPELVPFLIGLLQDRKALVRSITCWTLSRYCHFVVTNPADAYFKPLLKELLARILDGNKKVQEAACSAFATLEEEACTELVPYLGDILGTLVQAFRIYQAKNLLILYDAVGTLADSVGQQLSDPTYVGLLMQPLMEKWAVLGDEDKELFPLLECVSSVATALGPAFLPYCEPVFNRCVHLIAHCVQMSLATAGRPEHEQPDKDLLIVALDLLSGLAESLTGSLDPLVGNSQLVPLIYQCAQDPTSEVRQSSFALIGDLAKACYHHLKPYIQSFLPILASNLDPELVSVCNNAIWALGEVSLRMGAELKPSVSAFLPSLLFVMNSPNAQRTLLENTAITLGRLGISCTEELAPLLNRFVRACCFALRNIRDNADKESAFRGLCFMINNNPAGVLNDFIFLCDAIASWSDPPPELKMMFSRILHGFRQQVGDANWTAFTGQFPQPLKQRLVAQYAI